MVPCSQQGLRLLLLAYLPFSACDFHLNFKMPERIQIKSIFFPTGRKRHKKIHPFNLSSLLRCHNLHPIVEKQWHMASFFFYFRKTRTYWRGSLISHWKLSNLSLRKGRVDFEEQLVSLDIGHKVGIFISFHYILPLLFPQLTTSPLFLPGYGGKRKRRGIKCTVNLHSYNLTLVPWRGKCLLLTFPLQDVLWVPHGFS